ncbi:MAG: Fructokinase [Micavibrio sp.]|nr:Fructokinase [Micavibrio sp.]
MSKSPIDVLAMGNAMVDVLANVDEAYITHHDLQRGAMSLIDEKRAVELYATMANPMEMSGGSAGNTIAGLASFGGKGAYIGKVAQDPLGETFRNDMKKQGVIYNTLPIIIGAKTGRCLVAITPDGERTMNTYLGAGLHLSGEDLDADLITSAAITYLEGYMFDPPHAKEAFRTTAEIAHSAGRMVSITLSDAFCVDRHRDDFAAFVEQNTDILFANEAEITSLYKTNTFEEAAKIVGTKCKIAVLTRSAEGSVIVSDGKFIEIKAEPISKVVDTTGAGDQYAAGFLYGLSQDMPLETCGRLGSLAAAEVISHMGPRPLVTYADLVKKAA